MEQQTGFTHNLWWKVANRHHGFLSQIFLAANAKNGGSNLILIPLRKFVAKACSRSQTDHDISRLATFQGNILDARPCWTLVMRKA